MAELGARRALHFVFKVADRVRTVAFYRDVLGMRVLRHEEFEEGCKASCNGPYDGRWSKTMVGYGGEDDHFVMELTYNYGIKNYRKGNEFLSISIYSKDVVERIRRCNYIQKEDEDGAIVVEAPGGYNYRVYNRTTGRSDPVFCVSLGVSSLDEAMIYWNKIMCMKLYSKNDNNFVVGYGDNQTRVELVKLLEPFDLAEAFGRIAFSCPDNELTSIQKCTEDANYKVLTPLVSLDTPGKATVRVVIVADPDGHEICFVGGEAFRQLSRQDPKADQLLNEAMAADKSNEWFAKKAKKN